MQRNRFAPLLFLGFLLTFTGVLVHQAYPIAGQFILGSGIAVSVVFLLLQPADDRFLKSQSAEVLSRRPQLTAETFGKTFFSECPDLAAKLRNSLAAYASLNLDGLLPDDNLSQVCDTETNDPSLAYHIEKDFRLGATFNDAVEFCTIFSSLHTFRDLLDFLKTQMQDSDSIKNADTEQH